MRRFSTARLALRKAASNPRPLVLRPPIEPRAADVATPADHPMWQFFAEQKYMRTPQDINETGNSWTIPQLRRKSFEDLHTLWYVCLKEWNRLAREERIVQQWLNEPGKDTFAETGGNAFAESIDKIRETMWHIRHVLAERYHGFRQSEQVLGQEYPKLLEEFSRDYLEADSNADAEVAGQLERFQYAFFGINPLLEGNFPEPQVLKGLYAVARLKLLRFGSEQTEVSSVDDVREAFLLFTCDHTPEGVAEAISNIKDVREAEPVEDEMTTLAELMHASRATPEAPEADASSPNSETKA